MSFNQPDAQAHLEGFCTEVALPVSCKETSRSCIQALHCVGDQPVTCVDRDIPCNRVIHEADEEDEKAVIVADAQDLMIQKLEEQGIYVHEGRPTRVDGRNFDGRGNKITRRRRTRLFNSQPS